jgi:hypothetical protein
MQNEEEKLVPNCFDRACEIVFLTAMAIVVYVGAILLLSKPIAHRIPWFFGPIGFFTVLGLDVLWIIAIKSRSLKTVQTKIARKILSVWVFALSAWLLTLCLLAMLLSSIRW